MSDTTELTELLANERNTCINKPLLGESFDAYAEACHFYVCDDFKANLGAFGTMLVDYFQSPNSDVYIKQMYRTLAVISDQGHLPLLVQNEEWAYASACLLLYSALEKRTYNVSTVLQRWLQQSFEEETVKTIDGMSCALFGPVWALLMHDTLTNSTSIYEEVFVTKPPFIHSYTKNTPDITVSQLPFLPVVSA